METKCNNAEVIGRAVTVVLSLIIKDEPVEIYKNEGFDASDYDFDWGPNSQKDADFIATLNDEERDQLDDFISAYKV